MDQLAGLSEEARKLALDRFRLLQPNLEQNQSLQSVARAAGIPYRTAHRWLAERSLIRATSNQDCYRFHWDLNCNQPTGVQIPLAGDHSVADDNFANYLILLPTAHLRCDARNTGDPGQLSKIELVVSA